jgi:hypothetical protein
MNISATTTSLTSLASLSSTSAVSKVSSTTDDSTTTTALDPTTGDDQTHISKLGELFSKLQDLESSDPAKAKQVLTSIASSLTDKANSAGNTDPHLQELADKFTQAADTGDLSALKPKGGGHHHRPEGPPPGPPPADDSSTTTTASAATATTATDATTAGAASKAASYTRTNPAADLESIISNALSGVAA